MPLKINVDGLAMKETDEILVEDEEETWFAYPHQLRARDLWENEDSFFAINHAPTGAGKTMSWSDAVYRRKENVLVMYPTKTLIRDQYGAIKEIFEGKYGVTINTPYDEAESGESIGLAMFSSNEFDRLREDLPNAPSRNGALFSQIVRRMERENDFLIVLTNPDIFLNIRHNIYEGTMARPVSGMFDSLIVDEFHHADVKGQHSLVFHLQQMRREEEDKSSTQKCMFLSATPEEDIQKKLETMPVQYHDLNEEADTRPLSEVDTDENWRAVLPPTNMEIRVGDTFGVGSKLLDEKWLDNTVEFCGREGKRTVIILDSIEEVKNVAGVLDKKIGDSHYVTTINGQTQSIDKRLKMFNNTDSAVLVTNSAGEIGVDYDTDQLIFSGYNPSTLFQRFGRLRNREDPVEAIAYVPGRAYERFMAEGIEPEETISREYFSDLVDSGYKQSRDPKSFPTTFGAHEAYMQTQSIAENSGPEKRETLMEEGFEMIENQYFEPYGLKFDKSTFLQQHEVLEESLESLKDFRSSGPSALVYDKEEDKVYTYSIEPLIRTGYVDVVSESEFFARLPESLKDKARRENGHVFGYIIWEGDAVRDLSEENEESPQPRNVSLIPAAGIQEMLSQSVVDRIPRRVGYFNFVVTSNDLPTVDMSEINNLLTDGTGVLTYALEGDRFTINSALELDAFFFLTDIATNDDACVAFSHDAMYLYCLKQEDLYRNNPGIDVNVELPESFKEELVPQPQPMF